MAPEKHKEKHKTLHQNFDELFADYIKHHPEQTNFTEMPLKQLLKWSYDQTLEPTELSG